MALSEKEAAFLWLAKQLDPEKVKTLGLLSELEHIGLSKKLSVVGEQRILRELERMRLRYTDYLEKRGIDYGKT